MVVLILLRCASFVEGTKQRRMKVFFEAMKVSAHKSVSSLAFLAENDVEFSNLKEIRNISKRFTGYDVAMTSAESTVKYSCTCT